MLGAVNEGVVACSRVLLEVKLLKQCSKQPAQSGHVSSSLQGPSVSKGGADAWGQGPVWLSPATAPASPAHVRPLLGLLVDS